MAGIRFIIALFMILGMAGSVAAQTMPAVPAAIVAAPEPATPAARGDAKDGLIFIELFSAERCPFCPQAERHMNDILADPGVIGFTCMVDYFDAGVKGALSQSFCTQQQDLYVRMLGAATRYTPQIVMNGRVQLPGYNLQKIVQAMRSQREGIMPKRLEIRPDSVAGAYDIVLPQLADPAAERGEDYVLRLVMIRRAPQLAIGEGVRQAREKMPRHVAVAIVDAGVWDGVRTVWNAAPPQNSGADAFIAVVQNRRTGAILAAGESALESTEQADGTQTE